MAADREFILHPGRLGLNLRDDPAALDAAELTNALNFRISARGSLQKRLGVAAWSTTDTSSVIVRLGTYSPAENPDQVVAYCSDGTLQTTSDGATWTTAATGLASGDITPCFVQFLNKLYIANGVDPVQIWDGLTLDTMDTVANPLTEEPRWMTVWQNRLFVAGTTDNPRRVWWSAAGDAEDWTDVATNFVDFPDGGEITALATARASAQDASTLGGGDGVLVFDAHSVHRIYDSRDNTGGYVGGGSNVIVDGSRGCVSPRSIAVADSGRLFLVAEDGVYSTDGHNPLKLESKKLGPVFDGLTLSELQDTDGCYHEGCYYLSYTGAGAGYHNRLLELYLNLPRDPEGQYPWMAHDISVRSMVSLTDDLFLGGDARTTVEDKVRELFSGSSDIDELEDSTDISCIARTAMLDFSEPGPKSMRRIVAYGWGSFLISVVSNDGTQEAGSFSMPLTVDTWNPSEVWGGVWGEGRASPVASDRAKYTKSGRFLALEIAERSQNIGPPRDLLGQISISDEGGMKITALHATITPLDSYR